MNILPVQKSKLNRGLNIDQFFPSVFVFDAHSCMVSPARLWELGVLCQQLGLLIAREEVAERVFISLRLAVILQRSFCLRLRANSSQDKAAYSPPSLSGSPE